MPARHHMPPLGPNPLGGAMLADGYGRATPAYPRQAMNSESVNPLTNGFITMEKMTFAL